MKEVTGLTQELGWVGKNTERLNKAENKGPVVGTQRLTDSEYSYSFDKAKKKKRKFRSSCFSFFLLFSGSHFILCVLSFFSTIECLKIFPSI
jgi:hypothetical protein